MNNSTTRKTRIRGLVLATVIGTLSAIGIAAPANAAYSDYCSVAAITPSRSGTSLYATSYASCSTPPIPTEAGAVVMYYDASSLSYQEFGAWGVNYTLGTGGIIGAVATPSCAGMGTAYYLTQGYGVNSNYETSNYVWSAEARIAC